ncbi:MAG: DUF2520 domain-containing protein [Pyrinomonadaceae bacterium]|nr:DUF2520 domain-containing protein [Pyrinomonadaceae bacterium]
MQRISIIGLGRMGGALAIALSRAGFRIADITIRGGDAPANVIANIEPPTRLLRPDEAPSGEIVLITTGDPEIAGASEVVSRSLSGSETVLHASGSLDSSVLKACADLGCAVGSMHPLVSISDPVAGSTLFSGRYFCLEGDEIAVAAARSLAEQLGGKPFSVSTEFKPLYHAAAVTSAGHVVALFATAIEMLSKCGLREVQAQKILFPLLESTVANLAGQRPANALTGSFARGDLAAFERHLKSFEGVLDVETKRIFVELGAKSVDLAVRAGAEPSIMEPLRARIDIAKSEFEC